MIPFLLCFAWIGGIVYLAINDSLWWIACFLGLIITIGCAGMSGTRGSMG